MRASLTQAGQLLQIDCRPRWVSGFVEECMGDALTPGAAEHEPDVHVIVSGSHSPFEVAGWAPLTRGALQHEGALVMSNACGSGFDLRVDCGVTGPGLGMRVEARFRPPVRERLAAWAMRPRFHLLVRSVLTQYPALWAAGVKGWAHLHASGVRIGDETVLVAGPGGVGRSSLLLSSLGDGALACTDNVAVSDGTIMAGLVEPMRVDGAHGRRMPHRRGEQPLANRVPSVIPDLVVVVARSTQREAVLRKIASERAGRVMEAGTYMAGELRRYWSFASTLALGTGLGPVHPPVREIAATLSTLPAYELTLGRPPAPSLATVLQDLRSIPA
jgi:hypothetical protein